MPITQVGLDAIHHGKKLFPLLCQLKSFGKGRIIYSTLEQQFPEPSFYRILLAQVMLSYHKSKTILKSSRGLKFHETFAAWDGSRNAIWADSDREDLQGQTVEGAFQHVGQTNQISRFSFGTQRSRSRFLQVQLLQLHILWRNITMLSATFLRWSEVTDYDPSLHAPSRPKHMELPPLLKLVMERNRKQRLDKAGQTGQETDLLLPAYKVYDKDVRLADTVEPNLSLADLIGMKYTTYKLVSQFSQLVI